jgi:hypothetical protein
MPAEEIALDEARITDCTFSATGGELRYDISHLHPDWGFLVQSYRIDSVDLTGRYIYTSEFVLFKQGEQVPISFASYPRALKAALWQVIFAVKRRFFEQVKPDIVVHFIKQPNSVAERLHLYQTYLNLPEYFIEATPFDIVYFHVPAQERAEQQGDFPYPFGTN